MASNFDQMPSLFDEKELLAQVFSAAAADVSIGLTPRWGAEASSRGASRGGLPEVGVSKGVADVSLDMLRAETDGVAHSLADYNGVADFDRSRAAPWCISRSRRGGRVWGHETST